jgi:hypothetical protein
MKRYSRAHAGLRRDGLPTLSRVPTELGREERRCERCDAATEHIIYRVPKRVLVVYVKNHENNVQATCKVCARSTVLTGSERDRALSESAGE